MPFRPRRNNFPRRASAARRSALTVVKIDERPCRPGWAVVCRANDPRLHRIQPDSARSQKGRASLTLPWTC